MSEIENGLSKNKANYASLSPLSFLERTRKTFPNQIAIEYKDYKLTYQQAGERCEALAELVRNKNYAVFLDAKTPAFVGDKAFELFVSHTNKDASEAPTLPHTLAGQKITNIDLGITSRDT